MGPSPMISEAPKSPRMVSPTSNLTGINSLENVQQISIRELVGPTMLHAPNPQIGNVIPTTRPKFQPDRTSDAPVGPDIQNEQSLGKQAISLSVDLQIENAPHAQNQYEILYLPTQQTVGPDSRLVGPTIDFSHSIHTGPTLEAPLPAGPSHLSTAPSYISSLLPTPILSGSQSLDIFRPVDPAIVPSSHVGPTTDLLQTSVFAYDYTLHDRLLTIAGPTGSLPLAVGHYAESHSVIDPVYSSSLHDRPTISVGPTSTLAHSEFFDPLLGLLHHFKMVNNSNVNKIVKLWTIIVANIPVRTKNNICVEQTTLKKTMISN
ncbi:Uncharacterized protein Fot_07191 [Forsythia ovata]|uniref:Uncharacterized protein n=1 Tax=Forsythia ovata TaxID=205694 RepID=A0ABD1WV42_9LAMI